MPFLGLATSRDLSATDATLRDSINKAETLVQTLNTQVGTLLEHAIQTSFMDYTIVPKVDPALKCYNFPEGTIREGTPSMAICFGTVKPNAGPQVFPKGACITAVDGHEGDMQCILSESDSLLTVLHSVRGRQDELCQTFLKELDMGESPADTCSQTLPAANTDADRFDRCCRRMAPHAIPYPPSSDPEEEKTLQAS